MAGDIATRQNGTTLEQLIVSKGIAMPAWDASDPASVAAWRSASEQFAQNANGEVTAIIGQNLRPGNIWESFELPALQNNPAITKITTIDPATGLQNIIFSR